MSAVALSGATVHVAPVIGFDTLSPAAAEAILYTHVLFTCEAAGIRLSSYGNCAGQGSLVNVERYNQEKEEHKLFNVERVQRAFASIDALVQPVTTYKEGSYGLKHFIEERAGEYLANGDCVAAMLLKGYPARFGKKTEAPSINASFKVKRAAVKAKMN